MLTFIMAGLIQIGATLRFESAAAKNPQIHVNRYDDPAKMKGGKRSKLEGNTL